MRILLTLGTLVMFVQGCGGVSKADEAPSATFMTCDVLSFDGTQGRRCENAEAVCFLLGDSALSCVSKNQAKDIPRDAPAAVEPAKSSAR